MQRITKKSNQKGFSVIEIILAIVILGLIGLVAWMFVQNTSKNSEVANTSSKTDSEDAEQDKPDQPVKENPELAWYSYTPSGNQYSFKIPDGWTLHKKGSDDTSLYSTGSLAIQTGSSGKVVNTVGDLANCGHFILDYLPYSKQESWTISFKTDSGLDVRKTAGMDEIGVSGGGMGYSYNITKGQKTIYVSYGTCKDSATDYHEVIEQALKTLSIS